jgi:hypothetical protein
MRVAQRILPSVLALSALSCGKDVVSALHPKIQVEQSIDFGDVQVGILQPYTLEVKDATNGVFQVTNIQTADTFTSNDYEFKVSETNFVVQAGSPKKLLVTFQPFTVMADPAMSSFTILTDIDDPNARGQKISVTVNVKGRGVNTGLEVVPNPVDFGHVLVGSSKTLKVTITNHLGEAVDITTHLGADGKVAIVNQGGLGRFEMVTPVDPMSGSILKPNADGSPALLQPGTSTVVALRYIPDPSEEDHQDRGRWVLSDCTSPLCDLEVLVLGIGTNQAVFCTPPQIDFGAVNPGSTKTMHTTCSNATSSTVSITGWQLAPGTASEFTLKPYAGVPSVLGPHAPPFPVEAKFSPTDATVGQMPVGAVYINGRNPQANRDLTPTRIGLLGSAGGPHIVVTPSSLTFGMVALGTTSKRRLLIENAGYSALNLMGVNPDSANTGAFTTDFSGSASIMAGASKVVEIDFRPSTMNAVTSTAVITSDDARTPTISVPLSGVGVALLPCTYSLTPSSVSFGIVQVMHTIKQSVLITNTGTNDCLVNDVSIDPSSSHAFGLSTGNETGIVLHPGDSHRMTISYTPAMEGNDTGSLDFYISDPTHSNVSVPLSGTGSNSALLISPNEIDFGQIAVGCSARDRTINIFNTGANATTILRIDPPQNTTQFTVTNVPTGIPSPPGTGAMIPPGQSIQFNVHFHASHLGADSGVINIFEMGKTVPYVLPLQGTGSSTATNTDRFTQLETPKVDILFMIDNSCSMESKQAELANNFDAFIRYAVDQGLDYHIAVITTDIAPVDPSTCFPVEEACGSVAQRPMVVADATMCAPGGGQITTEGQCGFFADGNFDLSMRDPSWKIISPQTQPTPIQAFEALAHQGTNGSGNEKGLGATYLALSPPRIDGFNDGFLRPDAYLAIVEISDADDQTGVSLPASVDFYINFFTSIKGFSNQNLMSVSAIVEPPYTSPDQTGSSCPDHSGENPAPRYTYVAERTGGITESICPGVDWSQTLQNLGLQVFGFKSRFLLSNVPAGTITVTVDGVPVPMTGTHGQMNWSYDAATNSVNFSPLAIPEPGSQIVITYTAECL